MQPAAERYRTLLTQLDRWSAEAQARHPGVIPCRAGCSACCHGPFDISVADTLLLRDAVAELPAPVQEAITTRATVLLGRMETIAPDWASPWDVRTLGEEGFDALSNALADVPCPLLDEEGRCRVYQSRPLVCRLIGLPMLTSQGEVIENACPIQDQFPAYAALDPQLFDLEALELLEAACVEEAAAAMGVDAEFETTIAAVVATRP